MTKGGFRHREKAVSEIRRKEAPDTRREKGETEKEEEREETVFRQQVLQKKLLEHSFCSHKLLAQALQTLDPHSDSSRHLDYARFFTQDRPDRWPRN
jgi:hypothetical protein